MKAAPMASHSEKSWLRFDLEGALTESGLPPAACECLRQVMRHIRLWPSEKAEVASELIAHFADGLEAGRSIEELIGRFGDPGSARALIARAKRRQRGPLWIAARLVGATALLVIAAYAFLFLRVQLAHPVATTDYVAILNQQAEAVPENERAYPLYVEASEVMEPLKPLVARLQTDLREVNPQDPAWSEVVAVIAQTQPVLDKLREAARQAGMGYLLPQADGGDEPAPAWRSIGDLPKNFIVFRTLLHFEALDAARSGNAALAAADIETQFSMADHLGEIPVLLHGMFAVAVDAGALNTLGIILADHPSLFDSSQLRDLARRLQGNQRSLAPNWEGEHLFFRDFIQRVYTDNGAGDGYLAADWASVLGAGRTAEPWWQPAATGALLPLLSVSAPSRQEALRAHRAMIDALISDSVTLARGDLESTLEQLQKELWPTAFIPWKSSLDQNRFLHEINRQRQAMLLAIALEQYRREFGTWPTSIEALIPGNLAVAPSDPRSRRPLRFEIEKGHPVISWLPPGESKQERLWPR